jgi:hypothetical protein
MLPSSVTVITDEVCGGAREHGDAGENQTGDVSYLEGVSNLLILDQRGRPNS